MTTTPELPPPRKPGSEGNSAAEKAFSGKSSTSRNKRLRPKMVPSESVSFKDSVETDKIFQDYIDPYIAKMLAHAAIIGIKVGTIERETTLEAGDEQYRTYTVNLNGINRPNPSLSVRIISGLAMRDEELITQWDSIVDSGLEEELSRTTFFDDDDDSDEDSNVIEEVVEMLDMNKKAYSKEAGFSLMVYGEPILACVVRSLTIVRNKPPRVSSEVGYVYEGEFYPAYSQYMETHSARATLVGGDIHELELFKEATTQLAKEFGPDDIEELEFALVANGIEKHV